MNQVERVVTIFRRRRDTVSDKLAEALTAYGIDPDLIQTIYQKESPEMLTFFRVESLPSVLCFAEGEEVSRLVGKEIETNTLLDFLNS